MISHSKVPSFKSQSPFSPIERVAGRLLLLRGTNEIFVSGSCVRIAKNLYLTARHVIEDYLERFGRSQNEASFNVWVAHVLPGPDYSIWEIDRCWFSPHSDIAVFH